MIIGYQTPHVAKIKQKLQLVKEAEKSEYDSKFDPLIEDLANEITRYIDYSRSMYGKMIEENQSVREIIKKKY